MYAGAVVLQRAALFRPVSYTHLDVYKRQTGDTANEPMVIGGGTYAKSLKNIIAFGPEKLGIDYRIHGADEYILVSGMEEAVLVYMEAIKNLLAI